jgi:hypothetical protein
VPYIPGSPINANCAECQTDTNHVVLEATGMQVRRVRCEKCNTEGEYRPPRDKARAALLEISKKKKVAKPKKTVRRKKAQTPEQIFESLIADIDTSSSKKYSVKAELEPGDLTTHSSFGLGVVTALTGPQKATIVFESGERVMVCNRS